MSDDVIYHMCRAEEWAMALAEGSYEGSSQDKADGFIHFSTKKQVWTSAAKHRRGQPGIILLCVDAKKLGKNLKWEPSRGGDLFPHLYGPLDVDAVIETIPLPLGDDDVHVFPSGFPPPSVGEK
ncbi:MAG: DUF952 domain-containing protein [Rhodospirillales bacterium]|nr:DUF952 domain-containing protein [Rhodospirillales bacterium]